MEKLTIREEEIVQLLLQGCDNDDVAKKLFISKHTVKAHLRSIMKKTTARNRTHLIYIASQYTANNFNF